MIANYQIGVRFSIKNPRYKKSAQLYCITTLPKEALAPWTGWWEYTPAINGLFALVYNITDVSAVNTFTVWLEFNVKAPTSA